MWILLSSTERQVMLKTSLFICLFIYLCIYLFDALLTEHLVCL